MNSLAAKSNKTPNTNPSSTLTFNSCQKIYGEDPKSFEHELVRLAHENSIQLSLSTIALLFLNANPEKLCTKECMICFEKSETRAEFMFYTGCGHCLCRMCCSGLVPTKYVNTCYVCGIIGHAVVRREEAEQQVELVEQVVEMFARRNTYKLQAVSCNRC